MSITVSAVHTHDIWVWSCLWQQLGVWLLIFWVMTNSWYELLLQVLFWFHRLQLSASASKHNKLASAVSLSCANCQVCHQQSAPLHFYEMLASWSHVHVWACFWLASDLVSKWSVLPYVTIVQAVCASDLSITVIALWNVARWAFAMEC